MIKLRKREVFSLLDSENATNNLDPSEATQQFFRDLRPTLETQAWDPVRSYTTEAGFNRRELTVDSEIFSGGISWLLEDTGDITFVDTPSGLERIDEALYVHSPDWRTQASIKFIRNVFGVAVIDMSSNTQSSGDLVDLLFTEISLEGTTENSRDRVRTRFGASSGFFPKGQREELSKVVNGAPRLYDEVDPGDEVAVRRYIASIDVKTITKALPEDISVLYESLQLMKNALAYLRSQV